jgi:F-type H+-transporting ATPase subunit beta
MLKNYMTQSFTVVEAQTERPGTYVSISDAVSDVRAILDGKIDQLPPEDLIFIGTLKDVESKLHPDFSKITSKILSAQ